MKEDDAWKLSLCDVLRLPGWENHPTTPFWWLLSFVLQWRTIFGFSVDMNRFSIPTGKVSNLYPEKLVNPNPLYTLRRVGKSSDSLEILETNRSLIKDEESSFYCPKNNEINLSTNDPSVRARLQSITTLQKPDAQVRIHGDRVITLIKNNKILSNLFTVLISIFLYLSVSQWCVTSVWKFFWLCVYNKNPPEGLFRVSEIVLWLRCGDHFIITFFSNHNMNHVCLSNTVICVRNLTAGFRRQDNLVGEEGRTKRWGNKELCFRDSIKGVSMVCSK